MQAKGAIHGDDCNLFYVFDVFVRFEQTQHRSQDVFGPLQDTLDIGLS